MPDLVFAFGLAQVVFERVPTVVSIVTVNRRGNVHAKAIVGPILRSLRSLVICEFILWFFGHGDARRRKMNAVVPQTAHAGSAGLVGATRAAVYPHEELCV